MDKQIRVLHVDDDPDIADLTATFLEQVDHQFSVETETSASDGLARLGSESFDCVISDYEMPGRDGIEFLESVRDEYPDLPFILFTGKGSEEIASEAISAGVTDYLQKGNGTDRYAILANRVRNSVERTRAEHERQRHLDAIETAQVGISILDGDGYFLYVNQVYADLYGYKPEEMIGEHWTLTTPEDSVERMFDEIVPKVWEEGHWRGETRGLRADGSTFIEDHSLAVTDADEIVCSIRNITDEKRRERRLEAILDNTYAFVGLLEPDGTVLEANQTSLEFADLELEEVVGEPIWETGWFDISEQSKRLAREAVDTARGGKLFRDEVRLQGADGEAVIDFTVRPVFDEQGDVTLLVPEGHDVTEQKQYVRRLETLIDNLPGMVYRSQNERGWPIDSVRGEVRELTGYERAALEAGDVVYGTDVVHPDDREKLWETVQEALAMEESFEITYRIVTKDGTTRWVWERGQGVYASDGSVEAVEGFIADVTNREQLKRELEQQNERLREFASVISHDLRTPLQVAEGRLELAREDRENGHLDVVEDSLDRMERIIGDVLWLAEHGEDIGETSAVSLRRACDEAWALAGDMTADAAMQLPDDDERGLGTVTADYDRILQLLENLFANAIEHAGPDVLVRVVPLRDGFAVEDDGPGIPQSERQQVFESGYSTADDGTGFGLQIVEQIVAAHGWTINVTEGANGGACFEITGVEFEE